MMYVYGQYNYELISISLQLKHENSLFPDNSSLLAKLFELEL